MSTRGLLIDYGYCTGCRACEMACQVEHGYEKKRAGIVVEQIGPWVLDAKQDSYQFDYAPELTDLCDLCSERTAKGKLPTCVKHCLAAVMSYGSLEELLPMMQGRPKCKLIVPKAGVSE